MSINTLVSENRTLYSRCMDVYGDLEPLSNEKTLSLLKTIDDNLNSDTTKRAKDTLFAHNIKFIYSQIKKYNSKDNFEYSDDLLSAAIEGFYVALNKITATSVDSYATKKGMDIKHSLLAHVSGDIQQSIKNFLRSNNSYSVSEYLFKQECKVHAALNNIENEFGESISETERLQEVSFRTNLTIAQVKDALDASRGTVSLSTTINDKDGEELNVIDTIEGTQYENFMQNIFNEQMVRDISIALESLSDTQKEVVLNFCGLYGRKQINVTKISKMFNKTRQWVYNTLNASYDILRNSIQDLEAYYFVG